ncbi:glycosyltransferase family 2 protein [Bacillus mobilis]|uniref:glycosyltransferase family 2 protein n=1 Tax=Bacillus mobilis TaxID=2026190 RepID=UPI0022E6868D|nr:glycosyltransferase [Bacillus mobilis]
MKPLVTIFTAIYNHEKYLEDYFTSIINQTYENIELILIDDCSIDDSRKIVKENLTKLKKRFSKVTYIEREINKGFINNCNTSVKLSEGKYMCIFASDDIMHPKNIELKVACLEKNKDYAMVYSDGFKISEEVSYISKDDGEFERFSDRQILYEGDIFQKLIDEGCFIPAPSALIRKEIIKELGGYSKEYMFEDYYMWLKISRKYNVGRIKEPLIYYRISSNSLSRSIDGFRRLISDQEKLFYNIKTNDKHIDVSKGLEKLYTDAAYASFVYNLKDDYNKYYKKVDNKNFNLIMRKLIINIPLLYRCKKILKG